MVVDDSAAWSEHNEGESNERRIKIDKTKHIIGEKNKTEKKNNNRRMKQKKFCEAFKIT